MTHSTQFHTHFWNTIIHPVVEKLPLTVSVLWSDALSASKSQKTHTPLKQFSLLPTVAISSCGLEAAGTLPHRRYTDSTVSLSASALEGSPVSFDFNRLGLNGVIFRYCVTCLECPLCNSCMWCVADCSLRPKLTIHSLHMAGWCVGGDGHSPTGGGMKGGWGWGVGVRPLGSSFICCGEKWTGIVWSMNVRLWRESRIRMSREQTLRGFLSLPV